MGKNIYRFVHASFWLCGHGVRYHGSCTEVLEGIIVNDRKVHNSLWKVTIYSLTDFKPILWLMEQIKETYFVTNQ